MLRRKAKMQFGIAPAHEAVARSAAIRFLIRLHLEAKPPIVFQRTSAKG
jgi:hypothetical protein